MRSCIFQHVFETHACRPSPLSRRFSTWKMRSEAKSTLLELCGLFWRASTRRAPFHGVITLNRKQRPLYWRITNHVKRKEHRVFSGRWQQIHYPHLGHNARMKQKPVISKRAPNDIRTTTAKCHGLFINVSFAGVVYVFFPVGKGVGCLIVITPPPLKLRMHSHWGIH